MPVPDDDAPIRVLFACVPATGHVTPMLPLAGEFARRGADVVVASGPDVARAVEGAALSFRQVCPGFGEWFAALAGRTPGPPGAGLPAEHVERYFLPRLFGEVGLAVMGEGLDALVRELAPDLMVFEQHTLAAPLAAARHGVPAVQHMVGLRTDPLALELAADAVTPAWSAAGLPSPRSAGLYTGTTLTVFPSALDRPRGGQPLRATPLPDPARSLPVELPLPDRPLVYVTLGTAFNEPAVFTAILRALADLPVTVLATVGRNRSAAELGEIPGNAVVVPFVPQEAVLPHCAAVVHHGGAGTSLGVLAHGLPSVVLPRGADNFAVAARMATAGAARVLAPEGVDEAAVREAVRAVLVDPDLRSGAERVAREIAGMPGPEDVVPLLLHSVPVPVRKAVR